MAFDAGSIKAELTLDYSGFTGGFKAAAQYAQTQSARITSVLKAETDKQKSIMASVGGKNAFDNGSMSAMRTFYQKQAAEAQKLRQVNRSGEEQAIRDVMAKRINAMREEARQAKVLGEADRRMYGSPAGPKPAIRQVSRSGDEQQIRDMMASRIKAMREEARQAKLTSEVEHRLYGGPLNPPAALRPGGSTKTNGAKDSGQEKGGYGDFLSDLNAEAGKKSLMGKTLKLLMGGGAIGGIAMGANLFAGMVDNVDRLAKSYAAGEMKGSEFAAEMLKEIPIAGKLGDAFAKLWGLASGETFEVAAIERETKVREALADAMTQQLKLREKLSVSPGREIADWKREADQAGYSGWQKEMLNASNEYGGRTQFLQDEKKKKLGDEEIKSIEADLKAATNESAAADQALRDSKSAKLAYGNVKPFYYSTREWVRNREDSIANKQSAADEATAKVTELEGRLNAAKKSINDQTDQGEAQSGRTMWVNLFQIGKSSVGDWVDAKFVAPVAQFKESILRARRELTVEMGKPEEEMRKLQMGRAEYGASEVGRKGGNQTERKEYQDKAQAADDLKQALEDVSRVHTGDALTDFLEKMRQIQALADKGLIQPGKLAEMGREIKKELGRSLAEDAAGVREQFMDRREKFKRKVAKLDAEKAAGLLTPGEHERAVNAASAEMNRAGAGLPAFIRGNSYEAFQQRYSQATAGSRADLVRSQLDSARKSEGYLKSIAEYSKAKPQVADISVGGSV